MQGFFSESRIWGNNMDEVMNQKSVIMSSNQKGQASETDLIQKINELKFKLESQRIKEKDSDKLI